MNPKGINFLRRGRRGDEVCGEGREWSPVPPGRSQVLSPHCVEPSAPCLEHGLDPVEQPLPLPGPLILQLRDPPTLAWGAEVKKGRLGVLPHQFMAQHSLNSIPILPWIPQRKAESTLRFTAVLRRESCVYPQGISSPKSLCHQLPSLICHIGYFWQITPSKSSLPCLSSQAGLVTSLTGG